MHCIHFLDWNISPTWAFDSSMGSIVKRTIRFLLFLFFREFNLFSFRNIFLFMKSWSGSDPAAPSADGFLILQSKILWGEFVFT